MFEQNLLSKFSDGSPYDPSHSVFEALRNKEFAQIRVGVSEPFGDVDEILFFFEETDQFIVMFLAPDFVDVVGRRVFCAFLSLIVDEFYLVFDLDLHRPPPDFAYQSLLLGLGQFGRVPDNGFVERQTGFLLEFVVVQFIGISGHIDHSFEVFGFQLVLPLDDDLDQRF